MIQESPRAGLESRLALNKVMRGDKNRYLTKQESEKNIKDNLVVVAGFDGVEEMLADGSINMKGKGAGTGLRLTTDGFILTAYHNIQAYEDDWRRINKENPITNTNAYSWMEDMKMRYAVVDRQKKTYPIDTTFWATDAALDIALIKAVILEKPEPIDFRITTENLEVDNKVKLLALKNQEQYVQHGKVISTSGNTQINDAKTEKPVSIIHDTFLTDAYGTPGFSGGPFVNSRGEFMGMILYILSKSDDEQVGYAGGAKAENIVNFIKKSTYELNK